MHKLVSVIIVHWNSPEQLEELLSKLGKDEALQVIVVDNASELSLESLMADFPEVLWILNKENLGFAAACSLGAAQAAAQWLLFLNPDVLLSGEEVVRFVEQGRLQGLDAFSPKSSNPDYSKPIPSVLSLYAEFSPLKWLVPLSTFGTTTLTGGILAIRAEVLRTVGGWDTDFFLWFEDSDLSKRLLDAGYKIGLVDFPVKHHGGASVRSLPESRQRQLFFSGMQLYAKKHFSPVGQLLIGWLARYHSSSE